MYPHGVVTKGRIGDKSFFFLKCHCLYLHQKAVVYRDSLLDSLAWQWTVLLIESEGFDPHVGNHRFRLGHVMLHV